MAETVAVRVIRLEEKVENITKELKVQDSMMSHIDNQINKLYTKSELNSQKIENSIASMSTNFNTQNEKIDSAVKSIEKTFDGQRTFQRNVIAGIIVAVITGVAGLLSKLL